MALLEVRIDGGRDGRDFAGREDGLARLGGGASARRGNVPDLERPVAHVLDHEDVIYRRTAERGAEIISRLGRLRPWALPAAAVPVLLSEQCRSPPRANRRRRRSAPTLAGRAPIASSAASAKAERKLVFIKECPEKLVCRSWNESRLKRPAARTALGGMNCRARSGLGNRWRTRRAENQGPPESADGAGYWS